MNNRCNREKNINPQPNGFSIEVVLLCCVIMLGSIDELFILNAWISTTIRLIELAMMLIVAAVTIKSFLRG